MNGFDIIGAFESTYLPHHDTDIFESTAHHINWKQDLDLLAGCGVTRLRYPVRWHRVEAEENNFDWSDTDRVLHHMRDNGFRPIIDLVHHTSYPRWLDGGFADPRFGPAYLRYTETFALRYPWVEEYTLFNEPFSTLFLAGHEGIWPPYQHGMPTFVGQLLNVLPAVAAASRAYAGLLPGARHVWVDACEHHTGAGAGGSAYAAMANERRFLVLDSFLGKGYDPDGPLGELLRDVGGERLLELEPGRVDILGLDYYAHCQWHFEDPGGSIYTPDPLPLAAQINLYWQHYGLPCLVTETNIRGRTSDRATWFKYVLEQCERARGMGVPLRGLCWFPVIDSTDWDTVLFRSDGHIDPVGVYWLDQELARRPSVMSETYARAAAGTPAADLPAYFLSEPVATWLRGYLPQMSHWNWIQAPDANQGHSLPRTDTRRELRSINAE
jgi:beta-glucosidase